MYIFLSSSSTIQTTLRTANAVKAFAIGGAWPYADDISR